MPNVVGYQYLRRIIRRIEVAGKPFWLLECDHRVASYDGASAGRSNRVKCPECEAEAEAEGGPRAKKKVRRKCAIEGCPTILSSYNKGKLCSLHRHMSIE